MEQFPAYISLRSRPVLIIGGGPGALAKARLVLAAGADLTVIAPEFASEVREELDARARLIKREPAVADIEASVIVFIADVDESDARRWADVARMGGVLLNVVDRPELCDFTTPSIIDRGQVTVSISTNGAAPVLGKKLRQNIEALLPSRLGELAEFAAKYRASVRARIPAQQRRAFWEKFFDSPIAAQILSGDEWGAHEQMLALINRSQTEQEVGVVHIVGAGPGDPELLTIKALRLLQQADVILYDRLVSDEILSLARRDAERFYVGKAKSNHAVPQEEIEARMIAFAREGKMVVRLKGGDPFVFGRGGEELQALQNASIPSHVCPGVTAATGCAASANMALTHRDFAQAVTFVTGHAKGEADPDLDWPALSALKNTLVVYMGVSKAALISAKLIEHGRAASTPVAVIENGTRSNQKVLKGTLCELDDLIKAGGVKGPALLVVGEVAALADGETLTMLSGQERLVA
ncbi:siroheme synthase CysG [Hyphococcus flavus]|uniref:Siroheme synthase CysG n=1 Tax=Hyphococcus flavus TaxID=1866326 RepID=A0AAE9ZDP4_9PROT|nr:siroheme synthase CysG [Hyphococcus flavus]WDI33173.1 siroheme synthase CysG [Hyphococcus flavus]